MGVGEGKSIGQWYGPNTVAQVLKYVPASSCLGQHDPAGVARAPESLLEETRGSCTVAGYWGFLKVPGQMGLWAKGSDF